MAIELYLLGATLILALVQILLNAHVRTRPYGLKWHAGPRDAEMPQVLVLLDAPKRVKKEPKSWPDLADPAYAGRAGLPLGDVRGTVLLAPACSSFDLFRNYQHRGDEFCSAVKSISRGAHDENPNVMDRK